VPFYKEHDGIDMRARQRVIELDRHGEVSGVTISQHMADIFDLPQRVLDSYYPAFVKLRADAAGGQVRHALHAYGRPSASASTIIASCMAARPIPPPAASATCAAPTPTGASCAGSTAPWSRRDGSSEGHANDDTTLRALRVDLAAAFRLTARFGWHESVGNHFSAAVSGTESGS
jgi:hypothetical protein